MAPGDPTCTVCLDKREITAETKGLGSDSRGYGKHLEVFEEGNDRIQLVLKGPFGFCCGELTL